MRYRTKTNKNLCNIDDSPIVIGGLIGRAYRYHHCGERRVKRGERLRDATLFFRLVFAGAYSDIGIQDN